jgi:Flp pilus assembly secretin CpaC
MPGCFLYGTHIMRRFLLATTLLAAFAASADAGGALSVPLDEVRVLSFAKPVATLFVGNPAVADVTIIDNRHAFVQGKSFGATNIVALDAAGRQIANQHIVVAGSGAAVVTLQKGANQTTYACAASRCQPSPAPGDGRDSYDAASDQIAKHQALLAKAAAGDGQ